VAPQFVVHVGKTQEAAVSCVKRSQMHTHLVSLSKSTLKDHAKIPMQEINLIGSIDRVVERTGRLKEAGVKHFPGLYFIGNDAQVLRNQMQVFAEEVTPRNAS